MEQATQGQPSSGNTAVSNPYAATALDLDVSGKDKQILADRGIRLAATVLDILIYLGFSMVVSSVVFMFGITVFGTGSDKYSFAGILTFILMLVILPGLACMVVQLVFMARYAQSIGKRVMKIRVVRASTGEPCGLGRYFWLRGVVCKTLALIIPFFGLIDPLMIFGEDRRCLHDRIADTTVVKV